MTKEGEALTLYPITSDSLARGLTGSHPRDTCEPSCIHIILLGAWLGAEKKKQHVHIYISVASFFRNKRKVF